VLVRQRKKKFHIATRCMHVANAPQRTVIYIYGNKIVLTIPSQQLFEWTQETRSYLNLSRRRECDKHATGALTPMSCHQMKDWGGNNPKALIGKLAATSATPSFHHSQCKVLITSMLWCLRYTNSMMAISVASPLRSMGSLFTRVYPPLRSAYRSWAPSNSSWTRVLS